MTHAIGSARGIHRGALSTCSRSPAQEVNRIRLAAEQIAAEAIMTECLGDPRRRVKREAPVLRRRALLADALLLTETMASNAYAVGDRVMRSLGLDDRLELYQSSGTNTDNARAVLFGGPIGIEFLGGYLVSLDSAMLAAALGHEIGHALAHEGNEAFAWLGALEGHSRSRDVYALAKELTADRFALLACRDLDAALRLEMHGVVGRGAPVVRFDTVSYLDQCRATIEDTLARGGTILGRTHPEHHMRGYAHWLFSETDLYASLTGMGEGKRSIVEVDAMLGQLIGVDHCASLLERRRGRAPAQQPHAISPERQRLGTAAPKPRVRPAPGVLDDRGRSALSAARDVLAGLAARVLRRRADDDRPTRGDLRGRFEEFKRSAPQLRSR